MKKTQEILENVKNITIKMVNLNTFSGKKLTEIEYKKGFCFITPSDIASLDISDNGKNVVYKTYRTRNSSIRVGGINQGMKKYKRKR